MSSPRLKIRCPSCQKDGSARAELINRRVSCKHCSYVFRVEPIAGEPASTSAPTMLLGSQGAPPIRRTATPPADRVATLELEIRGLRDRLSAEQTEAARVQALRDQLAQAFDSIKKGEDREKALAEEVDRLRSQLEHADNGQADPPREGLRGEELKFLRDQLDKARAEAEAEARKRREAANALAATLAGHARDVEVLEAEHAAAVDAKQTEHARALEALTSGHVEAIEAKEAEHAEALRSQAEQLDRVRADARAVEARRLADDSARAEAEAMLHDEVRGLREELARAESGLSTLRIEREAVEAEHARVVDDLRWQLADLEGKLGELEATRDRLGRVSEELELARSSSPDLEAVARERDEARVELERALEEVDDLRGRLERVDGLSPDWGYPSTEMEVPNGLGEAATEAEMPALSPETSTLFDGDPDLLLARLEPEPHHRPEDGFEVASLRAKLDEATELLGRREAELAEAASLRAELERARAESEAAASRIEELGDRVRTLEREPVAPPSAMSPPPAPASEVDSASIEADRKRAVDDAVKGAWADFERRLGETQSKLKAANARADLMEAEARETLEQANARERGLEDGDGSAFGEGPSMTSIRILDARGTARLTLDDAEARLALAKQVAVDRRDKPLIDRIGKLADKVRNDLTARNYTLAETLVRGAEIEVGLDPGGFSIAGLRIFRPSPTIVRSLSALSIAFDGVMRQRDLAAIRSTIDEMRTILGDQAGLPELRRVGRTPAVKRPIAEGDALRLFLDALEAENWLMRPIAAKKPLSDTSLTTYACLIEACSDARKAAERLAPERVPLLDSVILASCPMLIRRQQADGHFAFLDPRGRPSKLASVVEGMVARRPDSVKDGWVVLVDPLGMAQAEAGACGVALSTAGRALGRVEWTKAAQKAADWAMGQPGLANFVANAASSGLLARAYIDGGQDRHLDALVHKLTFGLLPGQVDNGRWIDSSSATTPNHLTILRALQEAWEAIPVDRDDLRVPLKRAIDLAMSSLLAECRAIGVPTQGGALRDLIRHRELFEPAVDTRLEPTILDSVTVIQELCHDGPKPKLGVAPDQLAALTRA